MSVILNILLIGLKFLVYPLLYLIELIKIIADKRTDLKIKVVLFLKNTMILLCWVFVAIWVGGRIPLTLFFNLIPTTSVLVEEGLAEFDVNDLNKINGSTYGQYGSSGESTSISFGGEDLIIDMSSITDSTTVDLPSGTYNSGTVLQRAEILQLALEICARDEITISPEFLFGIWYNETSASINCSGSIYKTLWPVGGDASSSGPFQPLTSWWETNGYAYVSKYENSSEGGKMYNASDAKSKGLTAPENKSRPCREYMPDAMYSAAYALSNTFNEDANAKNVYEWGLSKGLSEAQATTLRENSVRATYNGYVEPHKTWMPSFYTDLMKQKGSINQWYNLASSRKALNDKLDNELIPSVNRTTDNWNTLNRSQEATYQEERAKDLSNYSGTGWVDSSRRYSFVSANGGSWVLNGLGAMISKLQPEGSGAKVVTTSGKFTWPVPGITYISSKYGNRVEYWSAGSPTKFHEGYDIPGAQGTKIVAAGDGEVVFAGTATGYGNHCVVIKHADNVYTIYGHSSSMTVKVGDKVKKGKIIAGMGSEGVGTACHLHFQVTKGSNMWRDHVDPIGYLGGTFKEKPNTNGTGNWSEK